MPDLTKGAGGLQFFGWQGGTREGGIFHQTGIANKSHMFFAVNTANDVVMTLRDNGNVGIGTEAPTEKLDVNGKIATNEVVGRSDMRYKKNVNTITNALNKVTQMRGVYYHWDREKFPEKGFSKNRTIGVIAQEIEKVLPEVVTTDATKEGYKAVNYAKLSAVLIEAIKQQQQQIETLQKEVKQLKDE